MAIKQDTYLRPNMKFGNLGDRKRKNGMFMNPPSFTGLGGFDREQAYPAQGGEMQLERGGPFAQRGKPV